MTELVFNDEKHEYWWGSRRIPGATEILKVSGVQGHKPFVSEHDLWVGKAAHKVIELYAKGTLDPKSVDTQLVPRLEAYIKFEKATGFKAVTTEQIVFSELLGIASRIDLTGKFPDGTFGIVELKSTLVPFEAAIQTAIQRLCIDLGKEPIRRFGLQVGKDGKPSLLEFTDENDMVVARAAVTIYNYLRNNGAIK